eukprot:SAG31_NODE_2123_length_6401_cov_4.982069_4_plen_158_part_00
MLQDVFSHLTNYSVNKNSGTYNQHKDVIGSGAKWTLSQLFEYLKSRNMCDTTVLWERIVNLVSLTLLPLMQNVPDAAAGCFELYGFDVLIDADFHPWSVHTEKIHHCGFHAYKRSHTFASQVLGGQRIPGAWDRWRGGLGSERAAPGGSFRVARLRQ